jgi:hypothetical protein
MAILMNDLGLNSSNDHIEEIEYHKNCARASNSLKLTKPSNMKNKRDAANIVTDTKV